MEKRNIIVLIHHIHCQSSTSEGVNDEVYVDITTSAGDNTRYFFENPLIMRGEDASTNNQDANVDIEINATYLDWIDVELRERDSDTDTVSLGTFRINRNSKIENTVTVKQPSGDKEGIYDVSYRIIDKPIPTLRILGLKCEHDSDGCNTDLVDAVATVAEEVAAECADVLAKSPRPSRKLMAKGFDKASEIIGNCAELVKWIANALEGPDDIYMQHTDPDHPDVEGGPVFPETEKNYKMETGDIVHFEEDMGHYYRIPLDKGDVTVQLREDDPNKKDISVGSITIRQADYDRLKTEGAQIQMAADYFHDRDNGQGAIYHICYSVGIEDWSKPATTNGQMGAGTVDEPPEEGVYYHLVNRKSGMAMAISKENSDSGDHIFQSQLKDYSNQRWRVRYVEGHLQLICNYEQICAAIRHGESQNGDDIVLQAWENNDECKWLLSAGGEGYFYLLNKKTGKALSVEGESTSSGKNLVQYNKKGMDWSSQKWKFVRTTTYEEFDMPPEEGIYYQLVNMNSSMVMSLTYPYPGAGDRLYQKEEVAYGSSKWRVEYLGDDVQLINYDTGLVAGMDKTARWDGNYVRSLFRGESSQKQWKLDSAGNGSYYLLNKATNKALSVMDASTEEGESLVQYDKHDVLPEAQKWKFKRTSSLHGVPRALDAPPVEGIYYQIVNYNSDLVMEISKEKSDPGDVIYQGAVEDCSTHRWRIKRVGLGLRVQIINDYNGLCIGLDEGAETKDTRAILLPQDSPGTYWYIYFYINGCFFIENATVRKRLVVDGGSLSSGKPLLVTNNLSIDVNARIWKFVRTSKVYYEVPE